MLAYEAAKALFLESALVMTIDEMKKTMKPALIKLTL